jgi:hypothetical protein
MYNIILHAWSGGCVSQFLKQVEVVAPVHPEDEYDWLGYSDPLIDCSTFRPIPITAASPSRCGFSFEILQLKKLPQMHGTIHRAPENGA